MTDSEIPPDPKSYWLKALKARASGKYTSAQIDSALTEKLGVNFLTLTRQLYGVQGGFPGTETQTDPDLKAANQPPNPILATLQALGAGTGLGFASHLGGQDVKDYERKAAKAYPIRTTLARMVGSMAPAAITAGAMAPLAPTMTGTLAPLQGFVSGAMQAAPFGALAAYGSQPDLAHPDIGAMAKQIAAQAMLGGTLGALGQWKSTVYNPAAQQGEIATALSAPGEHPTFAEGLQRLEAQPPATAPVLEPLNVERSPTLRVLGARYVGQSPEAQQEALAAVRDRLAAVTAAKNAVANHVDRGYDAILNRPIVDPRAAEILHQYGVMAEPTGRNVFNLAKRLRNRADQAFRMKRLGTAMVNDEAASANATTADELRGILSNEVPGFAELQGHMAPYLERERALQVLMRQIQGRGLYPKGRVPPAPRGGGLHEAAKEGFRLTPYFGAERAARALVSPLFKSSSVDELVARLDALRGAQMVPRYLPPIGTGATAGLLASPATDDRFGILR